MAKGWVPKMGHPSRPGQTWPPHRVTTQQLTEPAMQIPFLFFSKTCDPGQGALPPYSFASEKCAWGSQTRESRTRSLLYQPWLLPHTDPGLCLPRFRTALEAKHGGMCL